MGKVGTFLFASLSLNVFLVWIAIRPARTAEQMVPVPPSQAESGNLEEIVPLPWSGPDIPAGDVAVPPVPDTKPPAAPRSQPVHSFSWRELESTNYVEYIKNLRRIQCPEETIRDIVSADLRSVLQGRANDSSSGVQDPSFGALVRAENMTRHLMMQFESYPSGKSGDSGHVKISLVGTDPNPTTGNLGGGMGVASAYEDSEIGELGPRNKNRMLVEDLVRARYGTDMLFSMQRQAASSGVPLHEFLKQNGVWIPGAEPSR